MMLVFIWVFQASLLASVSCALDGWESLGCWRDLPFRAIASLEGKSKHLSKNWKNRTNPLTSCAEAAALNKFKVFAVQDGGQCFGGPYAQFFFDQYGPSNLCQGGLGGKWSSDVYSSKTAFQRVLNEEKADQKPIKCSKPLDLVFLVDGSGGSSLENKLRWSEMLKFISKTTEEFDPDTTRFGVLRYGSSPKVIVNMTDNRDVLSMRDTLMTEKFPGGKRTINDAMKTAWKDLFKHDKRIANKVIVALTAGSLPYGPWGSTLFLTGRNIRVMAFGIDKEPTYRYLESIASWKRPENIYSLDSDQLLKSVPFVTKDICTGSKKQQVETVKKDKEIELFESNEFETVGSAVERQLERKSNMKKVAPMSEEHGPARSENQESSGDGESTKLINQPKKSPKTEKPDRKTVSKKKHRKLTNVIKTSENEKPGMSDSTIVEKQEDNDADDLTYEPETVKSVEKLYKMPDIDTFMYTGNAAVRDKTHSKDASLSSTQADLNSTNAVEAPRMPVAPPNTENDTSYTENKNEFRSDDEVKNEVTKIQTRTEDEASPTAGSGPRNDSETSVEKEALQKSGSSQQRIAQTKEPVVAKAEDPYSNRMLANEARKPEKSPFTPTEKQAVNTTTSNSTFNKKEDKLIVNANATETHRNAESASLEKQNTSALPNMKAKEISAVNESLKNQSSDGLPAKNFYKAGNKSNKDIDREVFSSIQKERDSFGEEDDEPSVLSSDKDVIRDSADYASKDEKIAEDAAALVNDDPYDPVATDSDTVTQRALEQKKKEIDILLKKLDENRRRKHRKRKRRKIRFSKFYETKDSMSDETFDNDIHDDIERNDLAKGDHEAASIQNDEMLQGQGNVDISPKHSYEVLDNDNTDTSLLTRHFHRISQNETKSLPVQRPLTPSIHVIKVQHRLYNVTPGTNGKLNYDIFEPVYSRGDVKNLTKINFDKLVSKLTSRDNTKSNELVAKSKDDVTGSFSDRQQFFLRHNISHKEDSTSGVRQNVQGHIAYVANLRPEMTKALKPREALTKTNNPLGYNANFEAGAASKGIQHFNDLKPDMTFPKQGLKERSAPVDNSHPVYGNKASHMTSHQDEYDLKQSNKPDKRTSSVWNSISHQPVHEQQQQRYQNIYSNYHHYSEPKEEDPISRTLHGQIKSMRPSSSKFSKFRFSPLPDIDSGSYKIQKVSRNRILVSLRSKNGELQTFFGTAGERSDSKQMKKNKQRKHKPYVRASPIQTSPSKKGFGKPANPHFNKQAGSDSRPYSLPETEEFTLNTVDNKKDAKARSYAENLKQTAFDIYDNRLASVDKPMSYSAEPQNADGITEKPSLKNQEKIESKPEFTPINKEISHNSKQTAFDLYDNRLASVDKPMSYSAEPQNADGITEKPSLKNQEKIESKPEFTPINKEISHNSKQTAFDLYDNRLASVDKPMSYSAEPHNADGISEKPSLKNQKFSESKPEFSPVNKEISHNSKQTASDIYDNRLAAVDKPMSYSAEPHNADGISEKPSLKNQKVSESKPEFSPVNKEISHNSKQTASDIYDNRLAAVDKPMSYSAEPQNADGITEKPLLKNQEKIESKPEFSPINKEISHNSKQTALDLYDNRLAAVDKPISYFAKPRNLDRLIITENDNPDTDASMIKLFLNSGNEESLLSTGNVGLKNLEKQSHLRHIVEQDLSTNIKEDEAFGTKQRAENNFGTKRNLTSYNLEENAKSFKKPSSLFGADEFGEMKEAKDFLATKSDEIGKDTTEESSKERKKTSSKLSKTSVNSSEKKASDKEVKASSNVEKTSVQEAKESEKGKKASEEASDKVEKTSDKAAKSSDKAESLSDKAESLSDKAEMSSDKAESLSDKAEKSSDKAEKSSDKAEKSSDKAETSSDKAEKSSDKAETSSDKQESSSNKEEKTSQKTEKSSVKAEKTSRKTAKTSFRHHTENASHIKHEKRYKESLPSNGNMSFDSSSQVSTQDDVLSKMQRDVTGCNRPMKVLYVVDVSEGIGTGPARKRRWDHLKRFLRTVNDKITHGGNMGYVVYDSEPRFISNLEPCDENTEYFVTSGECLCDKRAASYREGQSACTTHAPTLDESIEDWGAQGPRTAKALQLARRYFRDEAFGNAKKLIVLLTHQTSTDDVTSAEKDLKDDSISLVDIEIGERHNLRKRSSNFDEVIPRDHQMEVSFYKLDRAIEKIVKKICSEKNPSKVRRSRIHASMKHRRDRWK